jgi:hypothetical protein
MFISPSGGRDQGSTGQSCCVISPQLADFSMCPRAVGGGGQDSFGVLFTGTLLSPKVYVLEFNPLEGDGEGGNSF